MNAISLLAGLGVGIMFFGLALGVFMIVTMWFIFAKAKQPGWAIFIPIYNIIVLLNVAGKPWWWLFLLMIPLVNVVFMILVCNGISKNFGKDAGFTVGLIFLGFIFFPILAFSNAQYQPVAPSQPAE
jgi:hypothetical protein